MSKTEKNKKEKKPGAQTPAQPQGMTALSDQDLQQVQGGQGLASVPGENYKLK